MFRVKLKSSGHIPVRRSSSPAQRATWGLTRGPGRQSPPLPSSGCITELGGTGLGGIGLGLGCTWLGGIGLGCTWLGGIGLGCTELGGIGLGCTWLGGIGLGCTELGGIGLGCTAGLECQPRRLRRFLCVMCNV